MGKEAARAAAHRAKGRPMPTYEVMRTVLKRRIIEAPNAEEAKRIMSAYGRNDVRATTTDVIAEELPDNTALPKSKEQCVLITGSPGGGFSLFGPFQQQDDARVRRNQPDLPRLNLVRSPTPHTQADKKQVSPYIVGRGAYD